MKISWNYLQSFFNKPLDKDLVLERLTMAGLEVEEETPVAPLFSGVVVGEVVSCEKHPDADKLSLCKVNVGRGELLEIICGAPNVATGVKIPCATVGAVLPGDFKITPRKMRGIMSHGMLCSGDELGCPNGIDGLLLLPSDAPIGTDIREYLDLNDIVVEFKITPNRGDCLSYLGLVREIGALVSVIGDCCTTPQDHLNKKSTDYTLNVGAVDECPQYLGAIIEDIDNNQSSPNWLIKVLARSGIRSISPVVDITNYVMMVLGQPMHAFDLSQIAHGINVRMGDGSEKLTLIDGKEVIVQTNTLLIADGNNQALALAGVMGGIDSGVTENTTAILLESAFFAPEIIQGKAKQYGVSSDSAFRFERGVDNELQTKAANLAIGLILEICGGEVKEYIHFNSLNNQKSLSTITLNFAEIDSFIGEEIGKEQIVEILKNLGCNIEVHNDSHLSVNAPSYRFDLNIKQDIIEEIIRVYGYDKVKAVMPKLPHSLNSLDMKLIQINSYKQVMLSYGFNEIVSYAFIDEKYAKYALQAQIIPVKIQNPIAGLSLMRTSLLPGLLKSLQANVNRGHAEVKLFELARVFHGEEASQQPLYLSGLIYGKITGLNWAEKARNVDFYDLRKVMEELLSPYGELVFTNSDVAPLLHPGRSANIYSSGKLVGQIGQIHPALGLELGIELLPYVFEINLGVVADAVKTNFRSISKFQKVSRDLAFILDETVAAGVVLQQIKNLAINDLLDVKVFDIFRGGSLATNEKSVAFNFIFQGDRTLSDDEINSQLLLIKQSIIEKFSAKLR